MKTKLVILISLLSFPLVSFQPANKIFGTQETKTIEGVYDGHEDYGYNFITEHPDDGSEFTMTFQSVDEKLLNQFDLNSDALVGKKFKITYQVKIEKTKDENGFEDDEEILTITNLESL